MKLRDEPTISATQRRRKREMQRHSQYGNKCHLAADQVQQAQKHGQKDRVFIMQKPSFIHAKTMR